jgi:hypothetical protein
MQVMAAGQCESCDERGGEQHHGLLRSNQRVKLNPLLLLDPDTQFDLCDYCHKHAEDAPHKDNDKFLAKMIAKGGRRAFKARRIIRIDQGPLVIMAARDVNYNKTLKKLAG